MRLQRRLGPGPQHPVVGDRRAAPASPQINACQQDDAEADQNPAQFIHERSTPSTLY
jgi:hypothetical protein